MLSFSSSRARKFVFPSLRSPRTFQVPILGNIRRLIKNGVGTAASGGPLPGGFKGPPSQELVPGLVTAIGGRFSWVPLCGLWFNLWRLVAQLTRP